MKARSILLLAAMSGDMSLLPVTNPTSLPTFATHVETGDTALRTSTSTLPSMQTQLPVEEDPKAGRESV